MGTSTSKRPLDVEEILGWAIREELPKPREGGGGNVRGDASLLGKYWWPAGFPEVSPMFASAIGGGSSHSTAGTFWRHAPLGAGRPHPDAIRVETALLTLERYRTMPIEAPFGLADDIGLPVDETAAVRQALRGMPALVVGCAALGKRPPAGDERPEPARVLGANGKPSVLKDGTITDIGGTAHAAALPSPCQRAGLYESGAYCPLAWWPDPQAIVRERADYAVWHAGLRLIAGELAGKLETIAVLPPAAAARPWAGERDAGGSAPRIFRDLSTVFSRAEAADQARQRRMGERRIRDPRGGPGASMPRPMRSASVA